MEALSNLPWYVYVMIGIMIVSFVIQQVLPTLKKTGEFAKEAKRVLQSKSYNKNPNGSSLSAKELSALSVGAINGEQTSCYVDTLETGMEEARLNKGLNEYWGVFDRETALNTLGWLKEEGHRAYYEKLWAILTDVPQNEWESAVNEQFEDSQKAMSYLSNLSETIEELKDEKYDNMQATDFDKGILAWDLGRLVTVARMSHDKQFISKDEAWSFINEGYALVKQSFQSWEEIGKSYIIGRAMWGGENMMLDGLKGITKDLLKDDASPWLNNEF